MAAVAAGATDVAPAKSLETSDASDARSPEGPAANELNGMPRSDQALLRNPAPPVSGFDQAPPRDQFLALAGVLRGWIKDIGRDATWRFALASMLGCISTQIPLPNDTEVARGLLFLGAMTVGALMGKRLDQRERPRRSP